MDEIIFPGTSIGIGIPTYIYNLQIPYDKVSAIYPERL